MIVPQFWAEGRAQDRRGGKQITVHRFGWSDASQEDAQRQADARARAALDRLVAGERLARREPKVPYNGAEGVPIREEILSRHGEVVITRNTYGARCLNTPNVLFVDIDFADRPSFLLSLAVFGALNLLAALAAWWSGSRWVLAGLWLLSLVLVSGVSAMVYRALGRLTGGPERRARRRIEQFLVAHHDWHVRVYRTPAGLRVLALHRTFDPSEAEVEACFRALGADPAYVRMCRNQRCFRARVSPKPWRIGMEGHLRPRPGVWPVRPELLGLRQSWVARYEELARGFAACRFVAALGGHGVDPSAEQVQRLHDEMCQAHGDLALA